jgi:tail assembly chaperone
MDATQLPQIEIAGHTYRIGKLDAITQFHIVRKLGPLIVAVIKGLNDEKEKSKEEFIEELLKPTLAAISDLNKEDSEYVLFSALSAAYRQVGEKWVRMANGNRLQFEDTPMPTMMRLVYDVVQENLIGFFAAPPST